MRDLTLRFALRQPVRGRASFRAATSHGGSAAGCGSSVVALDASVFPVCSPALTVQAARDRLDTMYQGDVFDRGFPDGARDGNKAAQASQTTARHVRDGGGLSANRISRPNGAPRLRESVILEGTSAIRRSRRTRRSAQVSRCSASRATAGGCGHDPARDPTTCQCGIQESRPARSRRARRGRPRTGVAGGTGRPFRTRGSISTVSTADGRLVLLFRAADRWYLHGWCDWDDVVELGRA